MNKLILPDFKSFEKVSAGLNKIADAVKSTLGPQGQNVMIQHNDGRVTVTKDGVTVANMISFRDPLENIGAQLIKDVANKTVSHAGDGTTSVTVLAQAIFNEGRKNIASGANAMEIKKGIDMAVEQVVEYIKSISQPVEKTEQLRQVATIAANNNEEIGTLISMALEKVGKDGVITIEDNKQSVDTEVKYMEGFQFDRGWQHPTYVTDHARQECVLEKPYVLLCEKEINDIRDLNPLFEEWNMENSILIISENLGGEALATVILNRVNNGLKICSVRIPSFGPWRKDVLDDIAAVTGATAISEDMGMKLGQAAAKYGIQICGRVDKAVISQNRTILYGGAGDKDKLQQRIDGLRGQVENPDVTGFAKDQAKKRLARLLGGIAVILVGATTEIEQGEKKDRIDDALQATRAASEEGIVPGGGVTLLRALRAIGSLTGPGDQQTGINIIRRALRAPIETILANAGEKVDVVINKIESSEATDVQWRGYNAKTRAYEVFSETGIMDPTKVVRLCLENAASVAGMLLTSKTLIYNDTQQEKEEQIQASGRTFNDLV